MKKLIFICGSNGIGKSTACRTLVTKLSNSAYIDSDWCREDIPLTYENGKMQAKHCGLVLKSVMRTAIITSPFNYHFSWLCDKLYSC